VVLVNPAAERLLGKSATRIGEESFLALLDDPERMLQWLERSDTAATQEPELVQYKERLLSVYAATIRSNANHVVGSAALIRDVTEEKRLEQQLIHLSTTDGLTGLFNRRYLDETLAAELQRANRYQTPLAVFLFDVDHFKKFNDQHGHDQGDRVLQALAKEMRNSVRQVDHPCRYGGEEFVLILPNTPLEGATHVAERLRRNVEAMVVDGLKVTISIGVAVVPPLMFEASDAFLEAADRALYEAKANGRNQVRVAAAPA
jgi:diguanylate cyclase (GGDEF)-like protein/PAS domain S-box-containing protein